MAKRRKGIWRGKDTRQRKHHNTVTSTGNLGPTNRSLFDPQTKRSPLFPRWTPWVVTLVTFAIRVHHVMQPRNWWVLHPDEIYQSMEVAHSELFGYGHRPYEFIAPPKGNNLSHRGGGVAHSELFGYGHRPYEFIAPPKGNNLSHYQLRELTLNKKTNFTIISFEF
ncbi:hypothetical protein EGW08_021559 [Elysia chlorotica]|uniref:Mannosyltransferase n=1 Tax=Elysia chlorotica TaxID=188477 RepID=A0A433SN83_ELYCH|nr:hypothetical protein EGW08_021559 [Elysia chlorotica]